MQIHEAQAGDSDPSQAWKALLEVEGSYEHTCDSASEYRRIKRLGFAWRRILRVTRLSPGARVFELGCGGGRHLAALAANGFVAHGVDVSPEVVVRARTFLESVGRFADIRATVEHANFLEYPVAQQEERYDLCFHAGVVEHFLDPAQRADIWNKLVTLTKPGGWVVSMVPCGKHFLRGRLREERIMGYNVPEIDYGCELHTQEFLAAGLQDILCLAHNFFAFLPAHRSALLRAHLVRPIVLTSNATLPWLPLPEVWKERFASTLIAIGRKPLVDGRPAAHRGPHGF